MNEVIRRLLNNEKLLIVLSCIGLAVFFSPYIFLGKDAHILVLDNMDSNMVWVKMLIDTQTVFAAPDASIEMVFNGIPRSCIYSFYDLSLVWFKLFGPYWGYVINRILMGFIGYAGMYLLMKKHVLKGEGSPLVLAGCSLLFACLPFWSFNLTVAGMPLGLYSLLNFRNRSQTWRDWLLLLFIAFYAGLIVSFFFLLFVLGTLLIVDWIRFKKLNLSFLIGLMFISVAFVISHFPIFYMHIYAGDYISQRVEMVDPVTSFSEGLSVSLDVFLNGQFHAHSLHKWTLLTVGFVALMQLYQRKLNKYFWGIFLFLIVTSIFYGLIDSEVLSGLNHAIRDIVPLQLNRFHFLHPMLWYVLFAISLTYIVRKFSWGLYASLLLMFIQLLLIVRVHELRTNSMTPSYKAFYAERQFAKIKKSIGRKPSDYRVICVGFHPAIAQFNGFYTLDAYFADYPLEYKHNFRKVIAKELDKDTLLADYFDHWGSRCYAFSAEVGRTFEDSIHPEIQELQFDYSHLRSMGADYVMSSAEIDTGKNPALQLQQIFKDSESNWTIYLYQLPKK